MVGGTDGRALFAAGRLKWLLLRVTAMLTTVSNAVIGLYRFMSDWLNLGSEYMTWKPIPLWLVLPAWVLLNAGVVLFGYFGPGFYEWYTGVRVVSTFFTVVALNWLIIIHCQYDLLGVQDDDTGVATHVFGALVVTMVTGFGLMPCLYWFLVTIQTELYLVSVNILMGISLTSLIALGWLSGAVLCLPKTWRSTVLIAS